MTIRARGLVPGRRAMLAWGAAAGASALAGGCGACGGGGRDRPESGAGTSAVPRGEASARPDGTWSELTFGVDEAPPEGSVALVAPPPAPDAPVVIALHGRGEAGRGLLAGARGWRDDYAVERIEEHLRRGTIDAEALGGFVAEARLAAMRTSLASAAYRGVTLVTPYTPIVGDRSIEGAAPFAAFVAERLWPRVERTLGAVVPRERTGIDGVSMGGRLALLLAIARPERFASVGALQPALQVREATTLATALAGAKARSPFALRLVSSEDDPFLEAVRALHAALRERGVAVGLVVTPGPHDYAWNRGPGAAELLLHHERVLRGLPPP